MLCNDEFKRSLLVPGFFLTLTAREYYFNGLPHTNIPLTDASLVSITSTIGLRIASYFTTAGPNASDNMPVIKAIAFFQVSNLIWSFLTNISATSVVSLKAWYVTSRV